MLEFGVRKDPLLGEVFNNRAWRQTLNEVCRQMDGENYQLQVISPFGFELLENKDFLARNLRRFYAYIGVDYKCNINADLIAAKFKEILFDKLHRMQTSLINDIVIIFENNQMHKICKDGYICKPTDKLLDIQVRYIASNDDILTDYAKYVIASLEGMLNGKGDGKGFNSSERHRWRYYQLYVMQEALFGYLLPVMNLDEKVAYNSLPSMIRNSIQIFYNTNTSISEPTWQEKEIIDYLIIPRLTEMYARINSGDTTDKINLICNGYHFVDELRLFINTDIYCRAIDKVRQTYLALE